MMFTVSGFTDSIIFALIHIAPLLGKKGFRGGSPDKNTTPAHDYTA
jgi:hypothetical protein